MNKKTPFFPFKIPLKFVKNSLKLRLKIFKFI